MSRTLVSSISPLVVRPEYERATVNTEEFGVVQKPLTLWEKLYNISAVRKAFILVILALAWELYGLHLNSPLLFPTFGAMIEAFKENLANGVLLMRSWHSLKILVVGYTLGLLLAAIFTVAAITSQFGNDLLETLTSMFNPLPAIALLPLSLIWFGLGNGAVIFVLIHSVLWAVSLNTHSGFLSVSNTLRMVGANYGLSGFPYVIKILIPAAFPSILTGLKIGWAFSWRTLIAAELVFGVSSGTGGLGWFIYMNKNELAIANVFAGLFSVILIGLIVENLIFATIEKHTVVRWGMKH
jgi:NitT/TauT family transport system permease protein